MSIDNILNGFEEAMEEESALLELANVWVERTGGEVVEGVVWDRDD